MIALKARKTKIVLMAVFLMLVVARAMAPEVLQGKINDYLAKFSESYYGHIGDFDLSILRGAYRLENFTLHLKTDGAAAKEPFLTAVQVDVSVAWREIFKGRILTDIVADQVRISADHAVKARPDETIEDAKKAGNKLFPVEVERIELRNSQMEYKEHGVFIDSIDGRLSNVTTTENNPLSLLSLNGNFLGKTPIKIAGSFNRSQTPIAWYIAAEMQKLSLPDINGVVSKKVPLTFKMGKLDLYAEVKSEKGRVTGYLKPFLKDAEVVGDEKDFKNLKHAGIEISVALLNMLFRSGENHTVATRVLFSYEKGDFQWNAGEVLGNLFKHGYVEELSPGIENLLSLSSQAEKQVDKKDKKKEN